MKKLLSICFLSILLGLFSFGVRAQNGNGCTSGFWIENLQPDTIYGVVNMPPDGKLPLVHTLGTGHYYNSGVFKSNVLPGEQQMYELHFCNTCGLDPKTQVSLDWVLLRLNETTGEWEEVNANLSDYVNFYIYTYYAKLNQDGACQSIGWLGGQVEDGFGYCEDQAINSGDNIYDHIQGNFNPCSPWTNYPGAMHVGQGTPMAVLTALGQIVPAAGQVNIYSQNHDYFYLDFFEQTRNIVYLDWKQAGNYKLVMRLRERTGGTPWQNEFWRLRPSNDGTYTETDFVGGHQSCCGDVIVEDTIGYPTFGEDCMEVCEGGSVDYGRPVYHFDVTMPDTNVVFGEFRGDDPASDCYYFHTDSVNRFHFFVRETPQVQTQNLAVCKCTDIDLNSLVTLADTANKGVVSVRLEWSLNGNTGWTTTVPAAPTTVGTHTYYVRQVNIYHTCAEIVECTGPAALISVTIRELPAPTGGSYDICNESEATTMTLTVSRANDTYNCSNTSVWFLNGDSVYTGDSYPVDLTALRPATNIDRTITFTVKAYNSVSDCYSAAHATVTLTFHQTPEIVLSYLDTVCPHPDNVDFVMTVTSTQTEFPYTVNQTSDFDADYNSVLASPNNQQTTTYNKPYTKIVDFVCDSIYNLYYTVTDANGCFVKDTATFIAKDIIAPVVNPATWEATRNQCDFEGVNRPDTIKTLDGFAGLTTIYDNCGEIANFTCKDTTYDLSACENVLVRTYTFYDNCGNASTFTQTFTAHDQVAPYFVGTLNRPIYERLQPKRGMNCTFNSLTKEEFVMAFLGKVQDNCVEFDSAYLMNHAEFYWEESSRFGHVVAYDSTDIFRDLVGNQLTVEVVVEDDCGNQADTLAFWFEPDTLIVPNVTVDPVICFGDTAFLSFDSTLVDFGYHFDVAHPLHFQWGSLEADSIINFGNKDSVNTYVVPTAAGVYHVNMTVTDFYGCSKSSDYATVDVHAAPNIVIVPHENNVCQPPYTYVPNVGVVWEGSYTPNVGIVWLAARDASNPSQTIPNLTYQWTTSQSLNVLSVEDTTGLWIVPDSCTYLYDAQVFVTDLYGCTAVDSIWVPVKDTAPEYVGGIHHDIRPLEEQCRMTVGDFTHYVVGNLQYFCGIWPPKAIWQEPAADEELTQDTDVTVYVVSQCGEDTLKITDKFRALVYPDRIHVRASVTPREDCDPATFNFTAVDSLAIGQVSWSWSKGVDTLSHSQSFSNIDTVEAGSSTSVYVYKVTAIDSVNCVATDTVSVTVHETLPIPDYEVFPNTRCVELYNGLIRLKNMPKGYSYKLYYEEEQINLIDSIITQIPSWDDSVPVTSIIFDELAGNHTYWVLIITDFGCETTFPVYVGEVITYPVFHNEIDSVASTYCTANGNGQININAEPGYTYYVFDANGAPVLYPYHNLAPGDYTVIKENDTTECSTPRIVHINSINGFDFTVTQNANTHCVAPFNGKLSFTKPNVRFVVTDLSNDSVVYTGPSTTLSSLHPGQYSVFGTDTITGCTKTVTKRVQNNTSNPVFTFIKHDNQYCDNDANLVNGSITPSPATYTYQYAMLTDVADVWVEITDPTHLAVGQYRIRAIDANGCQTDSLFNIIDASNPPVVTNVAVENTICDPAVAGHNYDGKVTFTITNYTAGMTYTVILAEDTVVATNAVVVFDSLNAGVYNYKVIDNFMCVDSGSVLIEQQDLQDLILKQTPNTYCVGTFNKPGNGTITVMPPYDEVQYYYYSYYYAYHTAEDSFAVGSDVNVNYDDLINRFYWLIDTFYYVQVQDLRTGCIIADTITVELGRDTVLLTGVPTMNTHCVEPYNGEIQLHTSYIPAEFDYSHLPVNPNIPELLYPRNRVYKYSIDGGVTYQNDSLFTGLGAGVYYFTVYDTISGCVYNDFDSIEITTAPNDITINHQVTANHACVDSLYDGTITVSATTTTFDPAEFRFVLDHGTDTTDVVASWTYNSLSGFHTVTAIEIHSGCEVDSTFEVPNDDDCNTQINVDVRKYCLNEENAWITATATSDCEGDFTYSWRRECHNMTFEGASAPVATDREMCCFYTVTATNNLTGCPTSKRVEVCVYAAHPIQYTVDLVPIIGNSTQVCENESLTIGVVHNGWAQSWWTMNHVTDTAVINPEYEFLVSTPDSVAAYASDPNKWKFNKNVSFCLDVIDTNGCHATGLFNLVINPLVRNTVDIEVCDLFSDDPALDEVNDEKMMAAIGTEDLAELIAGTAEYPYVVPSFTDTIARTEGCDSIVTYNITVLGVPAIDADAVEDAYCYGVTLSDIMENVTITNAADTTYYVNGTVVTDMNYTFDYSVDPVNVVIECNSGDADCAALQPINFYIDSIPAFTADLAIDTLCAGGQVEINVPAYVINHHDATVDTVNVILVDSTDADNVIVTVLEENLAGTSYLMNPVKLSYNDKYFGFIVKNNCGSDTILTQLVVDTIPVGTVSVDAICANQTLTTSWQITNGVDRDDVTAVAYVKMPGATDYVEFDITTTVDYTYNGASLYYVLSNHCGQYTTPATTIEVSDKPTIVLNPDPLMDCVSEFDADFNQYYCGNTGTGEPLILGVESPIPGADLTGYVLPNGSPITESGWLLVVENAGAEDTYEAITMAEIKELAKDTVINVKYYATNACGSDTVGAFQIGLSDAAEVTVNVNGTMCRTSMVSDVVTDTPVWHSATDTEGEVIYKVFAEGEDITGTGHVITPETTTFESLLPYNGGKLVVIAVSAEGCGNDTADVDLNIPTWTPTAPVMQAACRGSQFSYFIETAPTLAINNATVASQGWFILNATTDDTEISSTTPVNSAIEVYYKWVTSCGDVITTDTIALEILDKPTVEIDDITICAGNTVDLAQANLSVTDPSNVVNGEPTWTINGEAYSATATYGAEYDNANIVVTVHTDCGDVPATATLHVNASPVVEVTGEDICSGSEATFTATPGYASYTFTLGDEAPVTQTSNIFTQVLNADETLTSFYTVSVSAVDEFGCASSADGTATIKVTSAPQFTFTTLDGTETHEFDANTGERYQYIWMVGGDCNEEDLLVYVEYDIYYEGELLTLDNISSYFCIQNSSANGTNRQWNTSNSLLFYDSDNQPVSNTSYYLGATPNEFSLYNYYGNHFPYSSLIHNYTTSNYYDDLWMHFLRNREVTQTVAPFKLSGDYKFVFRLYQTNRPNNFQNIHTDVDGTISADGYTDNGYPALGGAGFNTDFADGTHPTLTLLALDSIMIHVDGPEFVCAPVTAPELAPNLTVDEANVAPDMEVWPNPAPAITTTLKARVHNMSGEATVTLTSLSGTQIYAGKTFIDNDNYYFEFGVNNLSVGSYILTVRTGDAIITKKVVVSSLAQ